MIYVDASAVPDHYSGVRTRLRGLYSAYGMLDDAPPVTVLLARGSRLFESLVHGSIRWVEVDAPGGPWRRALRRRDGHGIGGPISLWHSETLPPLVPGSVPQLLTLHDLRFLHRPGEVADGGGHHARRLAYRWWVPRVLRRVRGVVAVSSATARDLQGRLGLAADRVHVVANAVDAAAPSVAGGDGDEIRTQIEQLGVVAPFFLAVGHLRRRKGLEILPRALRECADQVELVFVGSGPSRDEIQREAELAGVAGRLRFLGRQSDEVVAWLRTRALALLFPSRVEGFGFPVFEALVAGLPVITSALPCLGDLEGDGLLRCRRAPGEWARAMSQVLADPARFRAATRPMGEALRSQDWRSSARELADLYRRLITA